MKPSLSAVLYKSFGDKEVDDFKDCPQQVYDVLSMALATEEHRTKGQLTYRCVFCGKPKASKGRKVLATIKLLGGKDKLLAGADALITIDHKFWMENPEKQEAVLFHELCHLYVDEEGEISVIGHDIEEFYAVIARYGDWQKDLEPIAQQLNLLEESLV